MNYLREQIEADFKLSNLLKSPRLKLAKRIYLNPIPDDKLHIKSYILQVLGLFVYKIQLEAIHLQVCRLVFTCVESLTLSIFNLHRVY